MLLVTMVTDIYLCIQVENIFVSSSSHEDILVILKSRIDPVRVIAIPQTRRSTSHTHYRLVHVMLLCNHTIYSNSSRFTLYDTHLVFTL